MRFKGTILLAVIALLMGAYLLYVELPREAKKGEEEEKSKRVFSFSESNVTGLIFQYPEVEVELERHPEGNLPGGNWEMIRPLEVRANDSLAGNIASVLERLTYSRVVEEVEDLKPYGLDPPEFAVIAILNGVDRERLLVGGATPKGTEVYIQKDGEARVLLTDAFNKETLRRTVNDLRKREVLTFSRGDVKRIDLESLGPKEERVAVSREGSDWKVKGAGGPAALSDFPADSSTVNSFLAALSDLRAEDFVDREKEKKRKALGKPTLVVNLRIGEVNQRVEFFSPKQEPGVLYVATSRLEDPIFKLKRSDLLALSKRPVDFRDRLAVHFDSTDVDEVEVERSGTERYILKRAGGEWTIETKGEKKKMEGPTVSRFLSDTQFLRIEEFVDQAPPAEKIGLSPPQTKIVIRSTEKKREVTLTLGKEEGDRIWAASSQQPGTFKIKKGFSVPLAKRVG